MTKNIIPPVNKDERGGSKSDRRLQSGAARAAVDDWGTPTPWRAARHDRLSATGGKESARWQPWQASGRFILGCLASGLTPQPQGLAMTSEPGRRQQSLLHLYLHGYEHRDEGVTPIICNAVQNLCGASDSEQCHGNLSRKEICIQHCCIYWTSSERFWGVVFLVLIRQYVARVFLYIVPLLQISQPITCTKKASVSFSPSGFKLWSSLFIAIQAVIKEYTQPLVLLHRYSHTPSQHFSSQHRSISALPAINIYRPTRWLEQQSYSAEWKSTKAGERWHLLVLATARKPV